MSFEILPDTAGEIREVQLVNLQESPGGLSTDNWSIDELRDVLHGLWPELPERFELLPDAHCKIIDFSDERRTYYINESIAQELLMLCRFLEHFVAIASRSEAGWRAVDIPFKLKAVVARLGLALESRQDRAQRIIQAEENPEKNQQEKGASAVVCPECGSEDVQVESSLAEDGTPLAWGGFFCASCGYLVPKTVAHEP